MDYTSIATYRHTQSAPQWVMALLSLFMIVVFSLVANLVRAGEATAIPAILITLWLGVIFSAVLAFTRLHYEVTPSQLRLRWRFGWPNKAVDRGEIVEVSHHRNAWWNGWGIRKVARGWMWNVWGLDAVQLELDDGRAFRVGTDDPEGLITALRD